MELTAEQSDLLRGAQGPFLSNCMKLLVGLGRAMNARRLVPVDQVMVSGLGVPGHLLDLAPRGVVGDSMRDLKVLMEELARHKVKCPTICHAAQIDMDNPALSATDQARVGFQRDLLELAQAAGIQMLWSCVPYLLGAIPTRGQVCAYTEMSAVLYVNSVVGARSTKHGSESAVAAAVLGLVPEFGVLLDQCRRAELLIRVEVPLATPTDWGVLGYFVGAQSGRRIPCFVGAPVPRIEDLKQLCGGMSTTGATPMFHVVGTTPEASTLEAAFGDGPQPEPVVFGPLELSEVYRRLRTHTADVVDFVFVGSPHASLQEVLEVAQGLGGQRVAPGVHFVVATSYGIKAYAERLGYVRAIEQAGGHIMVDSCPVMASYPRRRRMVTDSPKQAHYSRQILGNEVILTDTAGCIEAAVSGRWGR